MRTLSTIVSMFALTFCLACSGGDSGDGGGGDNADANTSGSADASTSGPDAMPNGVADGMACTASQEDPTGGCPTGYECLSDGTSGACFKSCETAGAECPGYEGPGASLCIISITDQQMNPIGSACGTVCGDTTGMVAGCADGACDGTCPNTWTCVDSNQEGVKICQ